MKNEDRNPQQTILLKLSQSEFRNNVSTLPKNTALHKGTQPHCESCLLLSQLKAYWNIPANTKKHCKKMFTYLNTLVVSYF